MTVTRDLSIMEMSRATLTPSPLPDNTYLAGAGTVGGVEQSFAVPISALKPENPVPLIPGGNRHVRQPPPQLSTAALVAPVADTMYFLDALCVAANLPWLGVIVRQTVVGSAGAGVKIALLSWDYLVGGQPRGVPFVFNNGFALDTGTGDLFIPFNTSFQPVLGMTYALAMHFNTTGVTTQPTLVVEPNSYSEHLAKSGFGVGNSPGGTGKWWSLGGQPYSNNIADLEVTGTPPLVFSAVVPPVVMFRT